MPEQAGQAVDLHELLIRLAYRLVAQRQEKADLLDHFGAEPFAAALQRTLAAPLPGSVAGLLDLEAKLQNVQPVHSEPNPLWVAWMKTVHRQKLDQLRERLDALLREHVGPSPAPESSAEAPHPRSDAAESSTMAAAQTNAPEPRRPQPQRWTPAKKRAAIKKKK